MATESGGGGTSNGELFIAVIILIAVIGYYLYEASKKTGDPQVTQTVEIQINSTPQ